MDSAAVVRRAGVRWTVENASAPKPAAGRNAADRSACVHSRRSVRPQGSSSHEGYQRGGLSWACEWSGPQATAPSHDEGNRVLMFRMALRNSWRRDVREQFGERDQVPGIECNIMYHNAAGQGTISSAQIHEAEFRDPPSLTRSNKREGDYDLSHALDRSRR